MRSVLLVIGVLVLVGGALGVMLAHFPAAYMFVIWGAILIAALVYERFRYKPLAAEPPGAGWEKTSECFVDSESGKTVRVYIRPESGERQYVEE